MFIEFGLVDIIDILLVALMLFYISIIWVLIDA